MKFSNFLIAIILIFGVLLKLILTQQGGFLFNMDNARDFVDVREMIELGKLRLTGPSSAIEGLYNGPLWYYLLAIPYLLTHGDPYGAIVMQIALWVVGGFFLLKLVRNLNTFVILPIGLVWILSNYVVLVNVYSFNPNPVILLTPALIYFLVEYLKNRKAIFIILSWFLAGAFFNFEMNAGIFIPLNIFLSLILTGKIKLFKDKYFWFGVLIFALALFPQAIFDVRHDFIMTKGVIRFLSEPSGSKFDFFKRVSDMWETFFNVFSATLMNKKLLLWSVLILSIPAYKYFFSRNRKEAIIIVPTLFILVPFIGYLVIPVGVNAWHLGAEAAALLIVIAFIISSLWKINFFGKLLSTILYTLLIFYSISNIPNYFYERVGPNMDPSLYKNEIAAIDYVYKKANGANFKVYTYLPSVYDYPYQYLFWWYGKKTYGYVPGEYRYLPNRPQYIPSQDKFEGRKDNFTGLVFLIKEPDRNYTRSGWEGELIYLGLETIQKEMVGPIEIETRRASRKSN